MKRGSLSTEEFDALVSTCVQAGANHLLTRIPDRVSSRAVAWCLILRAWGVSNVPDDVKREFRKPLTTIIS